MAKKISLQLEINGVKQSVSSINDLEKNISELKNQLKGVDIGSKEFQKLQGEIRKAQNFAEDLNESIKPQGLEQRVQAYSKVGSAIVSSFAAAQSSLALFGEESEDIAKAAAKAQAVLTIALTAREVAEGAVALKTVAANIATVASTAAANAATTATRTLYATLASNPYTAIVAVVGLVAGALISFSDETEQATDVTKEFNSVVSEEATRLTLQTKVLQNSNTEQITRLGIVQELVKEYPGFNAFIDEENRLTKEGEDYIRLRIEQYKSEAKIKLLINKINAAEQKQIELTNEDVEKQITLWDELVGAIKAVGTLSPGESARVTALNEQTEKLIQVGNEQKQLNDLYEQEITRLQAIRAELEPLQRKLDNQVVIDEKSKKAKEDLKARVDALNKAFKEGTTTVIELSKAYDQLEKSAKIYQETITELNQTAPSSTTLEDIKRFEQLRKNLLNLRDPLLKIKTELKETFSVPSGEFETIFQPFRESLEEITSSTDKVDVKLKNYQKTYKEFINNNQNLTQEQIKFVSTIVTGYEKFEQLISETPGLTDAINKVESLGLEFQKATGTESTKGFAQLVDIFGELGIATGKLTTDFQKGGGLVKLIFDPLEAKKNSEKYFEQLQTFLFRPIGESLLETQIKILEFEKKSLDPTQGAERIRVIDGQLQKLTTTLKTFSTTGVLDDKEFLSTEKIQQRVNNVLELLKGLGLGITSAEEQILGPAQKINQAITNIGNTAVETSRAQGVVIAQNIESILGQMVGPITKAEREAEKFREQVKKDAVGLELFKKKLQDQGLAEQIKNNEDLLDAYVAYKKKEVDATKEAEEEKKKAVQDTYDTIQQGIQLFSSTLNEVASLSNQSIQNQLDFLEKSTQATLDQVVGNTESAEQKREEIRTQYAEERKQLEKKQAVSSLQFSLVQAIANAAQAITSVFAQLGGTPLAFIQSGIIAALTTAEIAIINEQINMAQMFRKGGLLKAQSGMLLSGPSHENGGIPLAQMGVIAEGQEAIINRNSVINFRDLLSTVNQAGGGRPLVVNSFDDSRIVEAIASQRQKPLRAYVLQSEITNEQALSKRLDDLSKI